jgi:hypothetical protein
MAEEFLIFINGITKICLDYFTYQNGLLSARVALGGNDRGLG